MKNKMKIPASQPTIDKQDVDAVKECLKSGWVSSAGPALYKFAEEFARFIGVKYALPVSNGTTALHLALLALGIKPNDEVIIPALTFVSPASVTAAIGAKPVFIDVAKNSFLMDLKKIEKKITKKTKAIVVVHLYGYPIDLDPILKLAKKYDLKVIEDCAEALGAKYKNRLVGSFGDIACFSFYGNKFITTGEGGMLTTNSQKSYQLAQLYCDHGMTKERRYYHKVVGFNYRMTAMQAALGSSQLKKIKDFLKIRQNIESKYKEELKNLKEIYWVKPVKESQTVCWLATFLVTSKRIRDGLFDYLAKKGIEARKVFLPIPNMPPYKTSDKFPNTKSVSDRGLSLPTFVGLTETQIRCICRGIKNFFD